MTTFLGLVRSAVVIMCPTRRGLFAKEWFSVWEPFRALGGSRLLGISFLASTSCEIFAYWLIGLWVTRTVVVATNVLLRTFSKFSILFLSRISRVQSEPGQLALTVLSMDPVPPLPGSSWKLLSQIGTCSRESLTWIIRASVSNP